MAITFDSEILELYSVFMNAFDLSNKQKNIFCIGESL